MPWSLKLIKPQLSGIIVEFKLDVVQVLIFLLLVDTTLLEANFLLLDGKVVVLGVSVNFPLQLLLLFLTVRVVHSLVHVGTFA